MWTDAQNQDRSSWREPQPGPTPEELQRRVDRKRARNWRIATGLADEEDRTLRLVDELRRSRLMSAICMGGDGRFPRDARAA